MAEPVTELELYLVRHGESRSNAGIGDPTDVRAFEDPVLTKKGLLQAQLLGEYYKRYPLDCVLASGLNRALETAAEVAQRQARANSVEAHPIFTECGVPRAFGRKTFREIQSAYPLAKPAAGLSTASNFVFTGEPDTDEARYARAQTALRYLRERFRRGERVMVVAHAAFSTFMLFAALDLGPSPAFDLPFVNTGVSKLLFYRPGTGRFGSDVHLVFHDDRSHLAAVFADELVDAT